MLLGQDEDLVAEEAPVAGVLADRDDGDQYPGGRSKIGCLCRRGLL